PLQRRRTLHAVSSRPSGAPARRRRESPPHLGAGCDLARNLPSQIALARGAPTGSPRHPRLGTGELERLLTNRAHNDNSAAAALRDASCHALVICRIPPEHHLSGLGSGDILAPAGLVDRV